MDWVGGLLMDIGSFDRVRINYSAVGTRRRRRRRVAGTYSFFNASYLNDVKKKGIRSRWHRSLITLGKVRKTMKLASAEI